MNGLENMTKKILGDAQGYAVEVKKNADAKIDELLLDYQSQADALRGELLASARDEAAMMRERAQSQAALAQRNELLRAKRKAIDDVFDAACGMLVDLPKEEYVDLLARLVAKYQAGPAEIILNERDAERIGSDLIKKIVMNKIRNIDISTVKISKTHGRFKGGLILRQGSVDTNCTAEVLCGGLRHELEPEVVKRLGL